jgi:DNA-binding protein H-NS
MWIVLLHDAGHLTNLRVCFTFTYALGFWLNLWGRAQIDIDEILAPLQLSHLGCANFSVEGTKAMAKDLDRMSLRELKELELKVQRARASVQDRSRAELRKKVEAMIADAGFKVSDIFGGRGGKGRTVAAKYANPDDPSETWTGRGRKPRWLTAKLQDGAKIEKFLIK